MRGCFSIFWLFLCVVPSHAATLHGVGDISRCWHEKSYAGSDGVTWGVYCDGHLVRGEHFCAAESGAFGARASTLTAATDNSNVYCWCRMTYPYTGEYVAVKKIDYGDNSLFDCSNTYGGACKSACANLWIGEQCTKDGYGDDCLADYGEGTFADELAQEKFLTSLFTAPCEIGISKLMLSTGDSFTLYADAYTQPTLVIGYQDKKCYAKLEPGTGTLNINYNDIVYHVVD